MVLRGAWQRSRASFMKNLSPEVPPALRLPTGRRRVPTPVPPAGRPLSSRLQRRRELPLLPLVGSRLSPPVLPREPGGSNEFAALLSDIITVNILRD